VGGPPREAGLTHRLDTLASGLLVAARTPRAHADLRRQFHDHAVKKRYRVLVWGHPADTGVVDVPIASRPGRRKVTVGSGQPACTEWHVEVMHARTALLDVTASTGRRHQVRAHLAHAGHPLTDDGLYGGAPFPAGPGPLLHAHQLLLWHPGARRWFTFHAPLFSHQQAALDRLAASTGLASAAE
jgi:23S rRNA pseudouridine1911/1915/1917 synthase